MASTGQALTHLPQPLQTASSTTGKKLDVWTGFRMPNLRAAIMASQQHPQHPRMKKAKLDEEACLGCGVCLRTCSHHGLSLRSRPQRVITPVNSVHRTVMMAIERGSLQNLIFDNRVLWNHRALAAVLGVLLRLPPIKQMMASKQVKSRYLEYLITHLQPRLSPRPTEGLSR